MAAKGNANTKGFGDARYRALIDRLVAARKERGLSQLSLGALLGRHQQFVSRYEIGERRLDVVEFVDVAKVLEIDAIALLRSL